MPATAAKQKGFTFDERSLRYRAADGRFVSQNVIRAELEKVRQEGIKRALDIGKRLQSGAINTAQFQLDMRDLVKSLHTVAGATARGGWSQMSPADWGKIGSEIKKDFAFLNNFGLQIEQGLPLDGRFLSRIKQYVASSNSTYENFRIQLQKRIGMTLARRVLHAQESCSGCVEEAAKGFVDIDKLAPLGSKQCRHNCRCSVDFK